MKGVNEVTPVPPSETVTGIEGTFNDVAQSVAFVSANNPLENTDNDVVA